MKRGIFFALISSLFTIAWAQEPRVLFIGNSYTEVNNLPQMVNDIAHSMGESINYTSNTPGGCTFMQHCSNHSMELIRQGGWDIVVLQEQSQYPSFPQSQVENEVFPYAANLIDSFYAHNPCGEPIFYMTWGRKNGDSRNATSFPVLGTYEGMDSMLYERYCYMAEVNDASLCPVGRVWRYLRRHSDIELYQTDESHPSLAGTYAAACAFYVLMFHRDPAGINYDANLEPTIATTIRNAVQRVVYDSLGRWTRPLPQSAFTIDSIDGNIVTFVSHSTHADSILWQFGDGTDTVTNADATIIHTYATYGDFHITATAYRHCITDTATTTINLSNNSEAIQPAHGTPTIVNIYPSPTNGIINIGGTRGESKIIISNIDGRIVYAATPQCGTKTTVDITNHPSGIYLLTIVSDTKPITKKIIKL